MRGFGISTMRSTGTAAKNPSKMSGKPREPQVVSLAGSVSMFSDLAH